MRKIQIILNERILKFKEVLVIDSNGKTLGNMPTKQALEGAKSQGLDLYLVSQNTPVPVCRIVDYGQMKYEEDKRARANHKPKQDLKEVKISPRIQQHDLDTFSKRAIKFLEHGDKVKVTCVFKAREIAYPHLGEDKMNILLGTLTEHGNVEGTPVLQGKLMSVLVSPIKR